MTAATTIPAHEAIADAIRASRRDLWSILPGRIVAVDGRQADVQPIPADYLDGAAEALPVIPDVPVLSLYAGGAEVIAPPAVGDRVTLLVCSRPVARYRDDGSEGDPQSYRTHDLSDAVALPLGLWPDSSAPAGTAGRLVIGKPTGGKVALGGGGATAAVARVGDTVPYPIDRTLFDAAVLGALQTVSAYLVTQGEAPLNLPLSTPTITPTIATGSSDVVST